MYDFFGEATAEHVNAAAHSVPLGRGDFLEFDGLPK
jgi:hypothetical protein